MKFEDIIGLKEVKEHLSQMLTQNRLSHALLFLGREGSGALPLAIAFADYIISNKETVKGKGNLLWEGDDYQNESFSRASRMMHPDLHFSFPVIPRKAGDKPISSEYMNEWREFIGKNPYGNAYDWLQFIGAENRQGNISAEECNDIMKKLSLKSFESNYKILIMWMPEYLGKEGNKLLKLIEEPPEKTLFLLVAEQAEQILPTILSRCQTIKIPNPTIEELQEALNTKYQVAEDAARQIASISEGNVREALRNINQSAENWIDNLREWLNALIKGLPTPILEFSDKLSQLGREKQKQFLQYFLHLTEQSLKLEILGEDHFNCPEMEKDFARRLNKIADINQKNALMEELNNSCYYIERNANPKMLFTALSIKLRHLFKEHLRIDS